ncbi:hypothetical protein OAM34_01175 [Alphaproteobacteria bacterium]|nr:hypothetical protein [Alphaproteobacteria bacterium]
MSFAPLISITSDVVIGLSAMTTAYFAFRGLSTWKEQHRGKIEYELARRLLLSIYIYRDAIRSARHPFMSYAPTSKEAAPKKSDKQREFEGYSAEYGRRYDFVLEARRSLYADVLESEVLWADEIRKITDEMLVLDNQLKSTIEYHLTARNPDSDHNAIEIAKEILKNKQGTLYAKYSEDDIFAQKFDGLVERAENYLKKKLKQ